MIVLYWVLYFYILSVDKISLNIVLNYLGISLNCVASYMDVSGILGCVLQSFVGA